MKLVVDSRENLPLDFQVGGSITEVIVEGLPIGDYAARWESTDQEMPLVFDRKTVQDLFGTLTSGMTRFKNCIKRANENKIKLVIIIEGSLSEVLAGTKFSSVAGSTIVKTLNTLWVKYDVEHRFCNNRSEMKRIILEAFEAIGRNFEPTTALDTSTGTPAGVEEVGGKC